MSRRRIFGLGTALALTGFLAIPGAAQRLVRAEPHLRGEIFQASYHLRLESAWPQLQAIGGGCINGGEEVVEGTLTRVGRENYVGMLTRRTRLLFCGAHGGPAAASCNLELIGGGKVQMAGLVMADETSPSGHSLRVGWAPLGSHEAQAYGSCSADFKERIEKMYLTVQQGVEFAIPAAGSGPREERLEDYAWNVRVN
ncbi:MAG: hypothetical protein H0T90_05215 [Gemmatimonadales bacterium]|nr:hypothetical protein [Gemmatimonadales bacterium]